MENGDMANQFYGWRRFGFSELAKGHLALWNPFLYCGAPYFAGFQSALLYPPNWVFLFLPLVFSLNSSVALHVFLAGFFTYLWLSHKRLCFLAALFGAYVFMLGGAYFLHAYPGHLANLCTMAWIPLVFLSVEVLMETPSLLSILKGTGILSLQLLSGHAQYFIYTLLMAGLYAVLLIYREKKNWPEKIFAGSVTFLLAMAVTAIQWLPALEASGEYGRAFSPGNDYFFSLHPMGLLSIFTPGLFGDPSLHSCWAQSRIWWESTPFLGTAAFLFALNALRPPGKGDNLIPLGLAFLSLLLGLGPATPFYPLLEKLPIFHSFRGSFKFCIFFQAFTALLAAKGLQSWLEDEFSGHALFHWAFGLAFLFLLAGVGVWGDGGPGSMEKFISLSEASFGFLLLGFLDATGRTQWKIAAALLGMMNLGFFAYSNLPSFDVNAFRVEGETLQAKLKPALDDGRVFWAAHNDRSLAFGLPDIWGDDPMVPKRYSDFLAYRKGAPLDSTPDEQTLNLTPVKGALARLVFLIGTKNGQTQVTPSPFTPLPRAFLVGKWRETSGLQETLEALSQRDFNPRKEVILEENPDPLPAENVRKGQISWKDISTDRIEFQVKTDKPQVLVMTDNYGTGWKALAHPDSSQSVYKVTSADGFARAIALTAGNHHFDLVYDPPGFTSGKGTTFWALSFYLLGWGWVWLEKRRTMAKGRAGHES